MTLFGIWLGIEVNRARTQRDAVATILQLGGEVYYKHQRNAQGSIDREAAPPGPAWLRHWLGDDYFQTPYRVHISSGNADACVAAATRLVRLEELSVDNLAIEEPDSGGYYQGWSDKRCRVYGEPLTDRGMESIVVADPGETDDQMAFAQRFVRFGPRLHRTAISDEAIQRLQQTLPKLQVRH